MTAPAMTAERAFEIFDRMQREAKAWRDEAKKAGAIFTVSTGQEMEARAFFAAMVERERAVLKNLAALNREPQP